MATETEWGPRVVVGLNAQGLAGWPALRARLHKIGAVHSSQPGEDLPDAVLARLAPGADVAQYVKAAQAMVGVRYAEAESFSSTFTGNVSGNFGGPSV